MVFPLLRKKSPHFVSFLDQCHFLLSRRKFQVAGRCRPSAALPDLGGLARHAAQLLLWTLVDTDSEGSWAKLFSTCMYRITEACRIWGPEIVPFPCGELCMRVTHICVAFHDSQRTFLLCHLFNPHNSNEHRGRKDLSRHAAGLQSGRTAGRTRPLAFLWRSGASGGPL